VEPTDEDVLIWNLAEEPPDRAPESVLRSAQPSAGHRDWAQQGILVMEHWVVAGSPIVREIELPLVWPAPLPITGHDIVIDLGTSRMPAIVEMRTFQAVDADGLPAIPAPSVMCDAPNVESAAPCRIARPENGAPWTVGMNLPSGTGTRFISMKADWVVAPGSPLRQAVNWTTFDAGWLFAVELQ
jgi:hypothetical protein